MSDPGESADNPAEIVITGKKNNAATPIPGTIGNTTPFSVGVQIGNQAFPLTMFDIEGGAYGSVGHAKIGSSIKMLKDLGISIPTITSQSTASTPVDIYSTDQSGKKTHVFSGEYVDGEWDYDSDTLAVSARDWAGVLVDQKRAITKIIPGLGGGAPDAPDEDETDTTGVSTVNVLIKTVVENIAKLFGLTPMVNLADGQDTINIGSEYGGNGDTILSSRPQSLWGFLNILARDSGNEVYVDPEKNLVFGIPGANTPIPLITLCYQLNPPPAGNFPVKGLNITHNVRRNSSFRVLVLSYNPATAQLTEGQAFVLGDGVTADGSQQVNPGVWTGNNAQLISKNLQGQDQKFPLYTFHVDGLTAAQAQARATAIANDIVKREFIVTCKADMIPLVRPMNKVKLNGMIDQIFLGGDYYVNRYKHTYRMPSGSSDRNGGMWTDLTLLNIKQQGIGSALTKKASNK